MKPICTLPFFLLFPYIVLAQPQPDTLDWHRYFPLGVGNVWEYQESEVRELERREIVGDTLLDDEAYVVMEFTFYPQHPICGGYPPESGVTRTPFVRYDTIGTVVALGNVGSDTLAALDEAFLSGATSGFFDLRSAFGDSIFHGPDEEDYYLVGGGYDETIQITGQDYEVAAAKRFASPVWFATYAADVGFLGGGNLWGPRITYARVGGIEYGSSCLATASEVESALPEELVINTIYPNPSRDLVTIEYHLREPQPLTVQVFNVLGQRVWSMTTPAHAMGMQRHVIKSTTWGTGMYVVRIGTERGWQSTGTLVVAR